MNFTTTPPTTPGFYAWHSCKGDDRGFSGTVWKGADGELWASVELRVGLVSEIGGEWCRLVPAEEVEKAFYEGWSCDGVLYPYVQCWNDSHAKQVAKGKI